MAIEDKYINTEVAAGKLGNPAEMYGAPVLKFVSTFEVAAADSDGSVYRIASLPANAILTKVELNSDAITGGADYELGLYKAGVGGAAIDIDCFMGTLDISGGKANGSEANGLSAVDIANLYKKLYEHAGDTVDTKDEAYDLVLTANTVGTAAGTVTLRVEYILG